MSSPRTLLDRLEHPEAEGERKIPGDPAELMQSIREHLQLMLNTRRGSSQSVPDFGTSDFSDFLQGRGSVAAIQEEILHTIQKYEPRLTEVEVTFEQQDDDPNHLHFNVQAVLATEEDDIPTVFRTVLESSGRVTIRS